MIERTRPLFIYLASGTVLLLALLVRLGLHPWLGDSVPLLTLFAAVGVAAWLGGYRPAIVVAVIGYLACAWLFSERRGDIVLFMTSNPGRLAALLLTSTVMIGLAEAMRSANRRAEDAAHQLHIITTTIPTPVTRCSRDLKYEWVSRGYAEWLDRSVYDVIGRPIRDVVGPRGFQELQPYFERVLRGETVSYETRLHIHKIGPRWISATYTPTRNSRGEVDGWVESVTDIDDLKQTDRAG